MRSASPACGNATTTRLPPRTKPVSSFSASASPRAAIAGRCASNENGCPLRERVELRGARERDLRRGPPPPRRAATSSGCQTKSGGTVEHRHEIGGDLGVLGSRRRPGASAPISSASRSAAGWIDGAVDGMERSLREGREGAHLLDLVAEELDAERLAARGREDVDDPATHRELAALLGPVDSLVAGERERLREPVEAGLVADVEPDRLRPLGSGRYPSASAVADAQTSPPRASTSSARARSPTRCGGGSSPEPQRTPRLGSSATRSGPRNQPAASAASRASASSGSRQTRPRSSCSCKVGEQERQRRLGDARPRRQRGRERLQPLVLEQLPDERVEYGTVHDERRKRRFRGRSVYDAAVSERAGESMTVAQRDALAAELAELEGPKRAEMVEAIATARGFGDLSENFAYHDAKNEQGLLERRITILRSRIENAVIVEHAAEGVVGVGSVVEVEDEQGGRFEVEISSVGGVSTDSPLGSALVGAKVGDTVDVEAPKGSWKARVVSVRSA